MVIITFHNFDKSLWTFSAKIEGMFIWVDQRIFAKFLSLGEVKSAETPFCYKESNKLNRNFLL